MTCAKPYSKQNRIVQLTLNLHELDQLTRYTSYAHVYSNPQDVGGIKKLLEKLKKAVPPPTCTFYVADRRFRRHFLDLASRRGRTR